MKVNYIYLIFLTNNTSVNNTSVNNTSVNNTSVNNTSVNNIYYPTPRWYKICKSSKKY